MNDWRAFQPEIIIKKENKNPPKRVFVLPAGKFILIAVAATGLFVQV
jgi:hypothetical protein